MSNHLFQLQDGAKPNLDLELPEKKWLSVHFCHHAEASEHNQQVLVKLSRCSGHYHLLQEVWIIVVHFLCAVFTWPFR